ncbi:DUF7853 family protein [Halobacterium bonnevillei]|uniref:Uncharacterized protein n=1 Tax=Halobacterium bonnevillei TaxID=2692200 RepID=A0A6B0SNR8_9EURY|nr:hypothetical protein [Halobacterium bonnevillei]MXR19269.1 hypothetical protein [Halobacterium bonnevillei]
MADGTTTAPESELEFSLAEQWALHSAVLDSLECALDAETGPEPAVALAILEKAESDAFRFTAFEYERICVRLDDYASSDDTPNVDREPAAAIVERLARQCPSDCPR